MSYSTPNIVLASIVTAAMTLYMLLWQYTGVIFQNIDVLYQSYFPGAELYYMVLAVCTLVYVFISGVSFIGITLKINKILMQILL